MFEPKFNICPLEVLAFSPKIQGPSPKYGGCGSVVNEQIKSVLDSNLFLFFRLPWVTHIIVPVNKTYLSYVQELVAENHYEKVTVIEGSHSRHRSIYAGVLELRKGKVHVPYL